MGIFSRTTPKKDAGDASTTSVSPRAGREGGVSQAAVLVRPYITERSTILAEKGSYVFVVHPRATKPMIAAAVKARFGVTPVSVAVLPIPTKVGRSPKTGRTVVTKKGGRKAIVTVKKGESIEFA